MSTNTQTAGIEIKNNPMKIRLCGQPFRSVHKVAI
jgi:hypothetical protein